MNPATIARDPSFARTIRHEPTSAFEAIERIARLNGRRIEPQCVWSIEFPEWALNKERSGYDVAARWSLTVQDELVYVARDGRLVGRVERDREFFSGTGAMRSAFLAAAGDYVLNLIGAFRRRHCRLSRGEQ